MSRIGGIKLCSSSVLFSGPLVGSYCARSTTTSPPDFLSHTGPLSIQSSLSLCTTLTPATPLTQIPGHLQDHSHGHAMGVRFTRG